eukprot:m.308713 g.308713  ORF g.308713 m.308713 type:complete len:63 (+) comp44591_c0_seq1:558-746(+)
MRRGLPIILKSLVRTLYQIKTLLLCQGNANKIIAIKIDKFATLYFVQRLGKRHAVLIKTMHS